jgi:hypothetical protein
LSPDFGAGIGLIGPHHAAAALNHNIVLAAGNFGRQGDLKLYGRADLERASARMYTPAALRSPVMPLLVSPAVSSL